MFFYFVTLESHKIKLNYFLAMDQKCWKKFQIKYITTLKL